MQLSELLQEPASSPIHDALTQGEEVLSLDQTIEFTPYVRTVLPIDGFVFWLNASILTPEALSQHGLQSPLPITVQGSLHYASVGHQEADQTLVIRQIDFTSPTPIAAFGALAPDVMYVGLVSTALGPFRFTFSRRNSFYQAAKIFHYVGDAVYPALDDLLIDDISRFDQRQVLSNSLPIWMSMLGPGGPPLPEVLLYDPLGVVYLTVPTYPAMLVLESTPPPYVAVEIEERPALLQGIPIRGARSSSFQQCRDEVRLITYGLRNDDVMDLRDFILDYSMITGIIGISEPPTVSDVRRSQVELAALAVKKQISLSVNYYQQRARDIARMMIAKAGVAVSDNPFPVPPPG